MVSIALVSHNSSGAFARRDTGHIGGVERQTKLLADYLARSGHRVSVITWADYPGQADCEVDGVNLVRICTKEEGLRFLRFIWPRWSKLVSGLKRANADIYFHNSAEASTGQVAMWAKRHGRRFVYSVASEPACNGSLEVLGNMRERVFYRRALRLAESIIVQTEKQRQLLLRNWKRDADLVHMPCNPLVARESRAPSARRGPVLWVGRIVPLKRLEMLFDTAELCPHIAFQVIGELDDGSEYHRDLIHRSLSIENVQILGRMSMKDVWSYYRKCSLLVCTSEYEGFPNTFLEAMYFGIPIVSTFDPDRIFQDRKLGIYVSDAQSLAHAIERLGNDDRLYWDIQERSIAYFDLHHRSEVALEALSNAIIGKFGHPQPV